MKNRGSAIVEFIFCIQIIALLLIGILFLSQMAITKNDSLKLASFGTSLTTSNLISSGKVEAQMQNYASALNSSSSWITGRFLDGPAAPFYQLFHTTVFNSINIPFNINWEISERVVAQKN